MEPQQHRPFVHKTLQFRINLLFFLLMLGIGLTIIIVIQTLGKSLIAKENYRFIEQKGRTIVTQLGQRVSYAEALSKSLANMVQTLPKDETLFKKTIPGMLFAGSHPSVAGGGIWPEPYLFEKNTARRSFFWGYNLENEPTYYNDYNNPKGPGYHSEEWYVPVKYLKKTDTYWSKSYVDPYSMEPMVTCTAPIIQNNKFTGVSTVDLKLNDLNTFLNKEAESIKGYIFAVDRNNKFLSFPDLSLVTAYDEVKKDFPVKDFITVKQLTHKEPGFIKIAEALEKMNITLFENNMFKNNSHSEAAEKIASESYQISVEEARLIVATFISHEGLQASIDVLAVDVKNDFFLGGKALASIFLMPKTFWKIVIVSPHDQVTKVADSISRQIFIYLSIGMLVCVLIAYLYLRTSLILPLKNMTNQLIRVVEGKESQLMTLPKIQKNELGDLAFWFNRRTEDLRQSNKRLNQEIEAHRKSQKALKKSEQQLSEHILNTPIGAVSWDLDFKVIEWNPAAEKIFGFTKQEALGKHVSQLILPDDFKDKASGIFKDLVSGKGGQRSINENITKGGSRIICDWYNTVLKDIDGKVVGVASLVNDITDKKKSEELLIQSEKMMSVGGLAAGMAHEINNPLAGMIQNAQVIQNRLTKELPANIKTAEALGTSMATIKAFMENRGILNQLNNINQAGLRAAKIINNMLSFSRKSDSNRKEVDMGALIDTTFELAENDYNLKKKYDFKKIEIVREYSDELPLIYCEENKIQQVIFNIVKNASEAIHFADRKGERPKLFVRVFKEPSMACIEIEDNGPGIDDKTRKRIFEPFFTTKSVNKGTGLGLSVSYFIIVDDHNGKMEVESTPGKGTKFIIKLPFRSQSS